MSYEWIERFSNDDGDRCHRRFLVDKESERVYGYVEAPGIGQLCFEAYPYDCQSNNRYLSWEAAESYLLQCATETVRKEGIALCGEEHIFKTYEKPVELPKPQPDTRLRRLARFFHLTA